MREELIVSKSNAKEKSNGLSRTSFPSKWSEDNSRELCEVIRGVFDVEEKRIIQLRWL